MATITLGWHRLERRPSTIAFRIEISQLPSVVVIPRKRDRFISPNRISATTLLLGESSSVLDVQLILVSRCKSVSVYMIYLSDGYHGALQPAQTQNKKTVPRKACGSCYGRIEGVDDFIPRRRSGKSRRDYGSRPDSVLSRPRSRL